MYISSVICVVLLLCGQVPSAENKIRSQWNQQIVIPDGSFVAKEPIYVLPHIDRRSIKCFQGPACHSLLDCLRSSNLVDC
jgi:hypothetical protein